MIQLPKLTNQKLFDQAFTHRSYLNEAKEKIDSNERLEFLGDSILSFIISKHLYIQYPDYDEGILTNLRSLLVNTRSLAELARSLHFGSLLKLSKGEEDSKGRENQSLLADSFEAYIGALFLDQGLDAVRVFLEQTLIPKAQDIVAKSAFKDPKSMMQEYTQAKKHASPVYKVLLEEGPAHARSFTIGVYVRDVLWGEGKGKSKQEGEENAAKEALEKMSQ